MKKFIGAYYCKKGSAQMTILNFTLFLWMVLE